MSTRPKANKKGKTVAERRGLTAKEEALVEAFLQTKNKSLAWRMAGFYKGESYTSCYTTFALPHIRAAIDDRLAENRLTSDVALSILTDHATGSLDPFVRIEEGPHPTIPGKTVRYHVIDIDRAKELKMLGVVKKLWNTQWGVGIELHDPIRAIEIFGKVVGWITEGGARQTPANNDGDLDELVDARATEK